jgi:hypothetical protein
LAPQVQAFVEWLQERFVDQIKVAKLASFPATGTFCAQCGSTLFWSRSQGEFSDWVSIALGTLDTPFTPQEQKHVYIASRVHWYTPASSSPRID